MSIEQLTPQQKEDISKSVEPLQFEDVVFFENDKKESFSFLRFVKGKETKAKRTRIFYGYNEQKFMIDIYDPYIDSSEVDAILEELEVVKPIVEQLNKILKKAN